MHKSLPDKRAQLQNILCKINARMDGWASPKQIHDLKLALLDEILDWHETHSGELVGKR